MSSVSIWGNIILYVFHNSYSSNERTTLYWNEFVSFSTNKFETRLRNVNLEVATRCNCSSEIELETGNLVADKVKTVRQEPSKCKVIELGENVGGTKVFRLTEQNRKFGRLSIFTFWSACEREATARNTHSGQRHENARVGAMIAERDRHEHSRISPTRHISVCRAAVVY